jgi:5-methylcytosine-specific restriction endonuclease McrA
MMREFRLKVCGLCKQTFQPTNGKQKYCGTSKTGCSVKATRQRTHLWHLVNREYEKVWHREHYAKNADRFRQEARLAYKAHPERYRQYLKRRAILKGAKGNFTNAEWEQLKKIYELTCWMCGKKEPEIKLSIDHKIPLSKGGSNEIDNIQPLCRSCNSRKNTQILFASCPLNVIYA